MALRRPRGRGKRRRLSTSAEFDRVFRDGRSHGSRFLVLHAFPRSDGDNDQADPRLGVSVGRKVGGAVERNHVKRLLREAFWGAAPQLPAGYDFVVVARPDVSELAERGGGAAVTEALRALLAEARLIDGAPE